MHDDMTELLEQANEIQESLGRSYAVPDEIDEADLEAGAAQSRPLRHIGCYNSLRSVELEALSSDLLDEEPSLYLAEVTAPDFIDEAPIEVSNIYGLSGYVHNSNTECQGGGESSGARVMIYYIS
jgi:charged multivesicular body protein 5